MRILVTGSRDHWNWALVCRCLDWFLDWARAHGETLRIVHGDCETGADAIAREWCLRRGVTQERFPADWYETGRLDRSAGPRRNLVMVQTHRQDPFALALAFPLGKSPGTRGTVKLCQEYGIPVYEL